jgi:dienelactone hydrolase
MPTLSLPRTCLPAAVCGLLLLAGLAWIPLRAFGQADVFETPEQLWRGFNPESPELEIESLKKWEEDGIALEKLRFTGERESGQRVRVFALRGAPLQGVRLPGILHIHGGGQTASLDWVRFWAKRGYVCVSYDFTGPWAGRKEYTDWGPITQGNMAKAQGGLLVRPTPRSSSWYHWALIARRALTLLSYHPKVDREKLGIFGVSIGGTLCWLVAGTDERVKTAVPIYGCGYNYDRRKSTWGFPNPDADVVLFNHVLAAEAYAPSIRRPLLLLDATNDFHGWMDDAYQALSQLHVTNRLAFTPRYNHHIDADQAGNLPAWMDWQLRGGPPFPAEPKLELRLSSDDQPLANVQPADGRNVAKVEVFYALGEKPPPDRFWRKAVVHKQGTAWQAPLPVMKTSDTLRAFANVSYQSGVCLSSNLARTTPSRLGSARATLTWSASPDVTGDEPGAPFVYAIANTDPNTSTPYFLAPHDPADANAININPAPFGDRVRLDIVSHYMGDPAYGGKEGQSLSFEFQGDFIADSRPKGEGSPAKAEATVPVLTVAISANDFTPRARTYTTHIDAKEAGSGWQRASLSVSQFQNAEGKALANWRGLDKIELKGTTTKQGPPGFKNFRWVSP